MKKIAVISSVMIGVFLMGGVVPVALAGAEPSPFQPEINKLGAITQNLTSIAKRVDLVLSQPPDPMVPGPDVHGGVNRLEAMDKQLQLLNGLLIAVMLEVLGQPPDPIVPEDLISPLVSIRDAAQVISDSILGFPPDPGTPEAFIDALHGVQDAAQTIVDNVTEYLESPDCGSYTTEEECVAAGCTWVVQPSPGEPYCGNP